jgi:16S rRNA (guanine527-N7)-methyltransferase
MGNSWSFACHADEARKVRAMSLLQPLLRDAATLGITLTAADGARLCALIDELERWNRTFNLTGIKGQEEMLTHHLLDSLSIHADLVGERIADVGTGAGFPGLPLALVHPVRFVAHAARMLGLANVEALQARAEELAPDPPFDTVVARACAPLPELLKKIAGLTGPATRVLAMKGKSPEAELQALPCSWRVIALRPLSVPGLSESRCLVTLAPAAAGGGPA